MGVIGAPAAAYNYESPAAAMERARTAGDPAENAPASTWTDAGWQALFGANDYTRARAYFERALALDPGLARALEGYGRTLEIEGDYEGALKAYLAFLQIAPEHPAAFVYLNRCYNIEGYTNEHRLYLDTLTGLLENRAAPAAFRAKAGFYLLDDAARAGAFDDRRRYLSALHPILKWQVIGPFDNEGKTGFEEVYPPEEGLDLAATYEGKARPVTWRPLPADLPTGFLDLTEVLEPADKCAAYLAVAVNAPADRDARLALGAGGAVKVWLNGDLIFERDAYHEGYFEQYTAGARLAAGANLLLVKICGDDKRWSFGARFTDAAGEPMTDVAYDITPAALAAAARTRGRGAGETAPPGFFDARIAAHQADAFDYYYAGLEHAARSDTDEREEIPTKLMLAAAAVMPAAAEFQYYIAANENQNSRILANLERALELAPGHWQAQLELAKYYYGLERKRDALALLDAIAAAKPGFTEAGQYRAKIYWEEGWGYDADALAAALTARVPDYAPAAMISAYFTKNYGDPAASAVIWRRLYENDVYSSLARDELYQLQLDAGDINGAAATMRRSLSAEPYDIAARRKLIAGLETYGRNEEALAECEGALRFRPEDYETWRLRGIVLEELGRDAEARGAYRTAITFKQNYPTLENYLTYLEPARKDGATSPRADAYEILASYPGDEMFPKDSAVWLLNDRSVEVFENGTSTKTVHQVIRILTPEGAQSFRELYIYYSPGYEDVEILRAAVIKPDGSELAATQVRDYDVFDVGSRLYYSYVNKVVTVPGLSPGDTVDFEYKISESGANIFADHFGDYFNFGGTNSTLRARYVLTLPANRDYNFRRLRGAPAPIVTKRDRNITYIFEMANLSSVDAEPFMPALAEILPTVQVSTFATWDEVGRWYNGLIKDVFRPSPEVEALAARLGEGAPDDVSKLARVYDFAVARIRYVGLEFGIGGYRPHSPKQCFETLYGDCKDKATFMNTIYRLMGFRAYPTLVRTADLGEMDYQLPMLGLFNHMISYVELPGGDTYFLDGTAEYHGYQELPAGDQGIDVLVIFDDRARFERTPTLSAAANTLETRTTIKLEPSGDAAARRTIKYGASDSPAQRERLHVPDQRRTVIEEFWNGLYPGTTVSNETFTGIDDFTQPVQVEYDAAIPHLYDPAAASVSLDAVIQRTGLIDFYGKKAARVWPLVVRTNRREVHELTYLLPPGYEIASAPLSKELSTPYGVFRIDVDTSPGRVTLREELVLNAQRIMPAAYGGFREFCLNVEDWESEPVILKRAR